MPDNIVPRVGMILHGYCEGYFGRDSHRCKRIEAIGHDWVVARELGVDELVVFASFGRTTNQEKINKLLVKWHTSVDPCSCYW